MGHIKNDVSEWWNGSNISWASINLWSQLILVRTGGRYLLGVMSNWQCGVDWLLVEYCRCRLRLDLCWFRWRADAKGLSLAGPPRVESQLGSAWWTRWWNGIKCGWHGGKKSKTKSVTTPLEIIPYYCLNHSIWSLSDNKEVSRWVLSGQRPVNHLTSQRGSNTCIKTPTKESPKCLTN
jgi:hypothetical protein